MATVRLISDKQLEANRRNASKSTGPTTEAGKQASRLNAVTHGLLAQDVVITAGDYKEDAQAFAQLLEDLRAQFMPEGAAEDLEVQTIAFYYWRKLRAVRYEHGAIRTRTCDLMERVVYQRADSRRDGRRGELATERASGMYRSLIGRLKAVKQEALDGTVSQESHQWLQQHFAAKFARPATTPGAEQSAAGPLAAQDAGRQLVAAIDEELLELASMRVTFKATEALQYDSKVRASALPAPAAVDKLIRYETSNDRALDRALRRLEGMQARRRQQGGAPAEQ